MKSATTRHALSLVEVVISIGILGTALAVLVGNVFSLNVNHRTQQEVVVVSDTVKQMVERLQGVSWSLIGADDQPWTWLRVGPVSPADPVPANVDDPLVTTGPGAFVPPMTESATDPDHNLLSDQVALLAQPSGVRDLRIWLEYRRMSLVENVAAMPNWTAAMADVENLIDVRNRAEFDPTEFDDALVIRVVARWTAAGGGERQYELSFSRRR
jgi:hypothetical protein